MPDLRLTGSRGWSTFRWVVLLLIVAVVIWLAWGQSIPVVSPSVKEESVEQSWPGKLRKPQQNPEIVDSQVSDQENNTYISSVGDREDAVGYRGPGDAAGYSGFGGPKTGSASEHTVRAGETLSEIAKQYQVNMASLASDNNIENPNLISVGQVLSIPQSGADGGIYHQVKQGDTIWDLARHHGVSVADILKSNDIGNGSLIREGQKLFIPTSSGSEVGASPASASVPNFSWPLAIEGRISSPFGLRGSRGFHYGLDIAAPHGTLILASETGRVVTSGRWGSYGLAIKIDHGGGYVTVYAHASRLFVRAGYTVRRGEPVALVGSTGRSTGPHLHFEIRVNGEPRDPAPHLR